MKKILIISIILFGLSPFIKAQMLNLNYQISVPFGDVKDFTDKTSFRGMDLGYHYFLGERFSLGASIGWNVYYQDLKHHTNDFKFRGSDESYTITGNQYRYINTVPILAIGRYYLSNSSASVQPYIGLGLGTSWTEKRLEVGQYASNISRWQFAMSPEIGMYVPLTDQLALNVGAKYNYATKAAHGKVPEIQSLSFSVGLILMGGGNAE